MREQTLRTAAATWACTILLGSVSSAAADRQLLIVLDGLRPDYVTVETMPNLNALAQGGVVFERHHAIYPTVTRANAASIAAGSHPGTHGLLGNTVYLPGVKEEPFTTSDRANLLSIAEATGGILDVQTLGDALEAAGKRLFVASSGSSGSSFLLHPRTDRGTIAHLEYTVPEDLGTTLHEEIGEPPEEATPSLERNHWVVSAYLSRGLEAAVAILWLTDPDHTVHAHGIGSEIGLSALEGVDSEIGRILSELAARDALDSTNVLVTSDHGFSTHSGGFDLTALVANAADRLEIPPPIVAGGALYFRPGSEGKLVALAAALQAHPAVGAIFSRPAAPGSEIGSVPGTLSYTAIDWNHPRAGDLLVSASWSSSTNSWGWAGTSASGGVAGHGSTSPFDVRNTLIASGPDFASGARSSVPSSNADLAPTLCRLIEVECPPTMTGRVLREALVVDDPGSPPVVDEWIVEVSSGDYRLVGRFSRVDGHRYFDSAGVERDPQSAPSGPPPPQ